MCLTTKTSRTISRIKTRYNSTILGFIKSILKATVFYSTTDEIYRRIQPEAFDFASKRPRSHLQSPDLNNLKDKQKLSRLAMKIEIILLKLMHLGHIDIITRNLKFNISNDQ